jgi:hypothetical protein
VGVDASNIPIFNPAFSFTLRYSVSSGNQGVPLAPEILASFTKCNLNNSFQSSKKASDEAVESSSPYFGFTEQKEIESSDLLNSKEEIVETEEKPKVKRQKSIVKKEN